MGQRKPDLVVRQERIVSRIGATRAKANRFMNFRHIGNGTECASPPSLINPIPPDSTVFCLRGAIASTTSDFVFKFRAIALTKTIIQLIPSSFSFYGTQKFHRFFNSKRVSFTSSSHQFGFVNCQLSIVNCELNVCHARSISITCMYGIWCIHVPPAFHARNL